jgi:hypothetical protein
LEYLPPIEKRKMPPYTGVAEFLPKAIEVSKQMPPPDPPNGERNLQGLETRVTSIHLYFNLSPIRK